MHYADTFAMRQLKKIFTPFTVSLGFSIILHLVFFAGVSDIGGFEFLFPLSEETFHAVLVTEDARISIPVASGEKPGRRPAEGAAGPKGTALQEEPASQDEAPPDEPPADSNPPPGNAVALDNSVSERPDNREPDDFQGKPAPDGQGNAEAKAETGAGQDAATQGKALRERLSYDLYWLNIFVGRAVLEATNDKGTVRITSQVHSTPFISTFYKVEDYAESVIVNGLPSLFKIKQREGKYRSDKETVFDPRNKKITFMNHLKGTRDEHTVASAVFWDVISGFYYLRTLLFEVGKTVYIDIFDSNKFFKAEVNILSKEKITLPDNSEIDTVVVRPVLKSEGLFQNKGEILIWLTDDNNKVPVRIETKVPIGKVVAQLKSLESEK